MNQTSQITKARRNLRALFILGLLLASLASFAGGLILALGYSRPEVKQPLWQFGQFMMLMGLFNLGIYLCLLFQLRKFIKEDRAKPPEQRVG